jgi:hypothetical protein
MDAGRHKGPEAASSEMGGGAAGQGSKETLRQALTVLQHVEELL